MSEQRTVYQIIATNLGATEPVNGSWLIAIANTYGITSPTNGSWHQAIAEHLGETEPINGSWIYSILVGLGITITTTPDNSTLLLQWANGAVVPIGPVDGRFYRLGYNTSNVEYSSDGITWSTAAAPLGNWLAAAYSPELDIIVASNQLGTDSTKYLSSTDGITWTTRSGPVGSSGYFLYSLAWNGTIGKFCSLANNTNQAMTSTDGITWTANTMAATENWQDIAASDTLGKFVAIGRGGAYVTSSSDGITWSNDTAVASADGYQTVGWLDGISMFVAGGRNNGMYSTDGTTWASVTIPGGDVHKYGIAWSDDLSMAVMVGTAVSGGGRIFTSPNGTTWTERTSPTMTQIFRVKWSPYYGVFVGSGEDGGLNYYIYSTDGITWANGTGNNSSASAYALTWAEVVR